MQRKATYEAAKKAQKKGKKAIKTGIFKWNPDYEAATEHFQNAAQLYEEAEMLKEAIECHLELGKAYDKLHDSYSASKAFEKSGELASKLKDIDTMQQSLERAAFYYGMLDNHRKAADCFVKMADFLAQNGELGKAEQIYAKQLTRAMDDDRFFFNGKEMLGAHVKLCLKFQNTQEYNRIIEMQKKFITFQRRDEKFPHLIGRAWICIAAVHLLWGEPFKVQECLENMLEHQHSQISDQFRALDKLLQAYKSGNKAMWQSALKQAVIQNLETDILKLLKGVILPGVDAGEENKEEMLGKLLIGERKEQEPSKPVEVRNDEPPKMPEPVELEDWNEEKESHGKVEVHANVEVSQSKEDKLSALIL